jgi:ribonuclease BN (tRNA processing enzyme)
MNPVPPVTKTREWSREGMSGPKPSPSPTLLTILGGGGWIPTGAYATCTALLRQGPAAVLIDAGTGIARLVADPSPLDGVEQLDLVLTHFHLDHVTGLAYLPGLSGVDGIPPRIHGPAQVLFGSSTEQALRTLIGPPYFDADFGLIASEVDELAEGEQEVGPFALRTRVQPGHSTPTLALRFGDALAYVTDTAYDAENVGFASGARLLVHEAWYAEGTAEASDIHASGREAATVARDAGVEELLLIHLHPGGGHDVVLEEARTVFRAVVLAHDGLRREL